MSIKEDIKNGSFKNVYLLWGEEDFLRDYYKNALVKKMLDPSFADFNYKEFTSKKPVYDEIEDFMSSYPFMSEKKILYIKDSDVLKKANETEKKFWLNTLEDMPDFVTIIFSETNVDKRSAIYKTICRLHSEDEFSRQREADLVNWIIRYTQSFGNDISIETAKYLIECCSQSMYLLKNEIEKLASYKKSNYEIKPKHIDQCCCKTAENRVFAMIDDLVEGKNESACKKYADLKLLREEPIAINGAIFSKFNQLKKTKILSETMSASEIAAKTGQKEFVVKIQLRQIKNIKLQYIDKILSLCAEYDHKIKNGLCDGWVAMDIIIASMI